MLEHGNSILIRLSFKYALARACSEGVLWTTAKGSRGHITKQKRWKRTIDGILSSLKFVMIVSTHEKNGGIKMSIAITPFS